MGAELSRGYSMEAQDIIELTHLKEQIIPLFHRHTPDPTTRLDMPDKSYKYFHKYMMYNLSIPGNRSWVCLIL